MFLTSEIERHGRRLIRRFRWQFAIWHPFRFIRCNLARREREDNWRPIESLVCDGRPVLLWMPGGMFIAPATKGEPLTHQERLNIVRAGYHDRPWGSSEYEPKFYCELPSPPTSAVGEK